jgi:hypothetical protein
MHPILVKLKNKKNKGSQMGQTDKNKLKKKKLQKTIKIPV